METVDASLYVLSDPLERGVYVSRVRTEQGLPVVFAVDSRGRSAGRIVIDGAMDIPSAVSILTAQLNKADSLRVLTLLRK